MSVFKSLARGGMVLGALIVLNGCSSEELAGNKYETIRFFGPNGSKNLSKWIP